MKNFEGLLFPLMLLVNSYLAVLLVKGKFERKKDNQLLVRDLWLIKEKIKYMSPRSFEFFCSYLLQRLGYRVEVTKASRDGGKDVICEKNGEYTFVECKHWKEFREDGFDERVDYTDIDNRIKAATPITQDIAQKLKGAMMYGFDGKHEIKKGIIITTTRFSEQCQRYCKSMNIEMWDIDDIMELVQKIGSQFVYTAVGIKSNGYDMFDDSLVAQQK